MLLSLLGELELVAESLSLFLAKGRSHSLACCLHGPCGGLVTTTKGPVPWDLKVPHSHQCHRSSLVLVPCSGDFPPCLIFS